MTDLHRHITSAHIISFVRRLTPDEWRQVNQTPVAGVSILRPQGYLYSGMYTVELPNHRRERWIVQYTRTHFRIWPRSKVFAGQLLAG